MHENQYKQLNIREMLVEKSPKTEKKIKAQEISLWLFLNAFSDVIGNENKCIEDFVQEVKDAEKKETFPFENIYDRISKIIEEECRNQSYVDSVFRIIVRDEKGADLRKRVQTKRSVARHHIIKRIRNIFLLICNTDKVACRVSDLFSHVVSVVYSKEFIQKPTSLHISLLCFFAECLLLSRTLKRDVDRRTAVIARNNSRIAANASEISKKMQLLENKLERPRDKATISEIKQLHKQINQKEKQNKKYKNINSKESLYNTNSPTAQELTVFYKNRQIRFLKTEEDFLILN